MSKLGFISLILLFGLGSKLVAKSQTDCNIREEIDKSCDRFASKDPYLFTAGARVVPNTTLLFEESVIKNLATNEFILKPGYESNPKFATYFRSNPKNIAEVQSLFDTQLKKAAIGYFKSHGFDDPYIKQKIESIHLNIVTDRDPRYCGAIPDASYLQSNNIFICDRDANLPLLSIMKTLSHEICHSVDPTNIRTVKIIPKNGGTFATAYVDYFNYKRAIQDSISKNQLEYGSLIPPEKNPFQPLLDCVAWALENYPSPDYLANNCLSTLNQDPITLKNCKQIKQTYDKEVFADICGAKILNHAINTKTVNTGTPGSTLEFAPELLGVYCDHTREASIYPPQEGRIQLIAAEPFVARAIQCKPSDRKFYCPDSIENGTNSTQKQEEQQ